ncbi:MAG: alpha/beta hydrolase [Microbacterium sp.]|uniref:alpha/beta fold hydrolase n=1 Tax=Microbacterium sp. TaxID=51671 RepID=UPI003BAE312F
MTHETGASGRARLAVEVSGSGAPVLMIHAGVTDRRSWSPLIDHLGSAIRSIRYDTRGFGETEYDPEDGWSPVSDAVEVLDAEAVDASIVIGCSMGGRAAIDLTLAHPDRVGALVLIAPSIGGAPAPDLAPLVADLDRRIDAADDRGDLDEVNRLQAEVWLDGPGHAGRATPGARALFLEMNRRALAAADPGDPAPIKAAWPRLAAITVPTLVLVGDLDLAHMGRNARHVAASVRDAELVELSDVAHLPHLEGHPETLQAIARFVAAHAG